jgi:cysteine synthase B
MGTVAVAAETKLGKKVVERIGNTPMIRLDRIVSHLPGITLLGKAEFANPGGSVKDRPALSIVQSAMAAGELGDSKPERALLDATSGNTGIAYAMLGAALQFPVTLCVPASASPERKKILQAYGAEVIFTSAGDGSDGAIRKVRELYGAEPERFFYADQYGNDNNWKAHYRTTANEIWEQTDGTLTHFIAAMGTSGTFMGNTRRLRELNPNIQCISMQPDSPFTGLEGLKHMPTAIVPPIYDPTLADRNIWAETEPAYHMCKRLAREEGVMVGVSAGANVTTALQIAEEEYAAGREAVIVTVLCDGAEKYLSERFWTED